MPQYTYISNIPHSNLVRYRVLMWILVMYWNFHVMNSHVSGQGRPRWWGGVSTPSITGIPPDLGHLNWSLPGLVFGVSGGCSHPHSNPPPGSRVRSYLRIKYPQIRVSCNKDTELVNWNTHVLYLRLISGYWAGYPPPRCRVSAWGGVHLKWLLLPARFWAQAGSPPPKCSWLGPGEDPISSSSRWDDKGAYFGAPIHLSMKDGYYDVW